MGNDIQIIALLRADFKNPNISSVPSFRQHDRILDQCCVLLLCVSQIECFGRTHPFVKELHEVRKCKISALDFLPPSNTPLFSDLVPMPVFLVCKLCTQFYNPYVANIIGCSQVHSTPSECKRMTTYMPTNVHNLASST